MLKLSRFFFETKNEAAQSFETRKITTAFQSQLSHRNVIIFIINESEKQKFKKMSNENLLIVMQKIVKKIKNVTRFWSDDFKIQIKSIAIKTILQTNHDWTRTVKESITMRNRIFIVRVHEIRMNHINQDDQDAFIAYIQKSNARLHFDLRIVKMIWSHKATRETRRFFFFYLNVIFVSKTNRLFIDDLIIDYEIKECERFVKNCVIT
jgi:hypothetical protein